MPNANNSRVRVLYCVEATLGVSPTTAGSYKPLRCTGQSLELNKSTFQSQESRTDRNIADFRHGGKKVGGDIDFELMPTDLDDLITAALCNSFTSKVCKNGVLQKTFSIEVGHMDINQFRLYKGCLIDKLTINAKPGAMVTGKISVAGLDMVLSGASIDSAPAAAGTASPFDTFSGSVKEDGSAIATITSLDINIDNGAKHLEALNSAAAIDISLGRFNVTGSISAYLQDASLYNKFLNETLSSIEVQFGSAIFHKYKLSSVKYGAGKAPTQNEGPVIIQLPFQAIYNAADACALMLTIS